METRDSGQDSPLIQLNGLSKVFYTEEVETHALSEIQLSIAPGEFVSIAGPSGCGKTTMLSILGLLDSPTGGEYLLDGDPVANLTASQRAKIRNQAIGFIFQAFNLIGDLTVYENVELPLTYRGMAGSERKERVQASLERVGMAHRMRHYPSQLSGGQQQRVAVALAIVGKPLITQQGDFAVATYEASVDNLRAPISVTLRREDDRIWRIWHISELWPDPEKN